MLLEMCLYAWDMFLVLHTLLLACWRGIHSHPFKWAVGHKVVVFCRQAHQIVWCTLDMHDASATSPDSRKELLPTIWKAIVDRWPDCPAHTEQSVALTTESLFVELSTQAVRCTPDRFCDFTLDSLVRHQWAGWLPFSCILQSFSLGSFGLEPWTCAWYLLIF
jgi:hypothetical protein